MVNAWLLLAAGDVRQHGGNDGYDDQPDLYYSWDSTVANHSRVSVGDRVVLWDKQASLGMSVVEAIDKSIDVKRRYRCPSCGKSSFKPRSTMPPERRYRCQECQSEFGEPDSYSSEVVVYRSRHDAAWVPLANCFDGQALRGLAESPRSQHSIRLLRWDAFAQQLALLGHGMALPMLEERAATPIGGHRRVLTRVRLGQSFFRRQLISRFGPVCAITGANPLEVLDAGHLYSYAELGQHEEHGGLLFRRDIHRLFDLGLLCINPQSHRIHAHQDVSAYDHYAGLQGTNVRVTLTPHHNKWLQRHWDQHR